VTEPGLVTHACNTSYSGSREDCGLRPPWAKSSRDPISISGYAQWHAPIIPATQGCTNKKIVVHADSYIKQDSISKIITAKRTGRMAQAVQHLPSKYKALSSTPVPTKKKKQR
jgi:hypothetical protein